MNSFSDSFDNLSDSISPIIDEFAEQLGSLAEAVEGKVSQWSNWISEALDSIQQSPEWLDLFGEPDASNIDHVSAQVTAGAIDSYSMSREPGEIDSYIENRPDGDEAEDVHTHLFHNLQPRFRIVEQGWDREIYSTDCLNNDADNHAGYGDHVHDEDRLMRNLELYDTELNVSDVIGLHGTGGIGRAAAEYNEQTTGSGINYHEFRLSNFSENDSIDERDRTLQNNVPLFRMAHHLAHNAEGNVMTHCRHGRHRARTVWLVVRILDNPPIFNLSGSYSGTPHYNELNDADREQVDIYI